LEDLRLLFCHIGSALGLTIPVLMIFFSIEDNDRVLLLWMEEVGAAEEIMEL
jgi:hypothetical protein